jgi:hypothetical protein
MVLGRPPKDKTDQETGISAGISMEGTQSQIKTVEEKQPSIDDGKYAVIFRHNHGTSRNKAKYLFASRRRMDIQPPPNAVGLSQPQINKIYEKLLRPGWACIISEDTYQYYKTHGNLLDNIEITNLIVEEIDFNKRPELIGKVDGDVIEAYMSIPFDWDTPFHFDDTTPEDKQVIQTTFGQEATLQNVKQ